MWSARQEDEDGEAVLPVLSLGESSHCDIKYASLPYTLKCSLDYVLAYEETSYTFTQQVRPPIAWQPLLIRP